ncbi:MAG: desulfoferrodoxin [Oscillospiraceae bacterium]|jgi:superoxide reductase|nr:desulfoferrodoxin [Oscillospiraceae bacterium]
MKKEHKFFICKHCGNIAGMLAFSGVIPVCCGEPMKELEPNTADASAEKHVPVIKTEDGKITVEIGSALHPMIEAHHINWIYIQTEKGGQRKSLTPTGAPSASFTLTDDDKLISAFAYCNLHGLWKVDA